MYEHLALLVQGLRQEAVGDPEVLLDVLVVVVVDVDVEVDEVLGPLEVLAGGHVQHMGDSFCQKGLRVQGLLHPSHGYVGLHPPQGQG